MNKQDVVKLVASKNVQDFELSIPRDVVLREFLDESGNNVLHLAASKGHAVIVSHLLENHDCKQLMHAKDCQGALALIFLFKTISYLIPCHYTVGLTPVDIAVQRAEDDVFTMLVQSGADLSGNVDGEPLIVYSSVAGKVSCVKSLLAAGVDPDSQTKDGVPLLFFLAAMMAIKRQSNAALASEYHDIIHILLDGGASPNVSGPGGFTPLHIAGEIGDVKLIAKLLDHGAHKDVTNIEQKTPADIAAEWEHIEAVQYLLYGAENDLIGTKEALTAATRLIEERRKISEAASKVPRTDLVPKPEDPSDEKYLECKKSGNRFFVSGDFIQAFEQYKKGLCHKTDDATLWANAAAAALRMGLYEEAIKHARVARIVDKKNVKAWYREGQAAEKLCLWEDAAAAYYEAFLVNNESDHRITDIDFAQLVKEAVDKGRKEFSSKQNNL